MSNWISVKDRLPEVFQHEYGEPFQFIVFIEGASLSTVLFFDGENWRDYDLVCMKYCSDFYRVTHWQPLPEPPDSKGFYVKSIVSKNKDLELGGEGYKFVDFVEGSGDVRF